ncbi:hypothetical protein CONPUDRAFT_111803 [Coniophora puteana RWD-64-598 SS2]|uniref:Uncharacterized protein n=1 Tax=Coniophora puteana (strain RWD-64-598) TaxID=741705 RepID=A0A5M3M9K3_CONPW|nr:uncharacterized protein CONPUDRAFT_111803 [Coniophora puteana RWD-64-598 SS2]EIW75962.1 hypothetical protein CONPUDRAFT_111803 [Coniophora puteana RWD-64-598 SS2]
MSNLVNKIKDKATGAGGNDKGGEQEQQFTIQPHPAKTNNPSDLVDPPQPGAGLNSNPEMQAHHARQPHVPSQDILNSLEQPKSREELRARQEELNRK